MAFKAAEVLDELSYDFHPYTDAEGVTPEPSTAKIQKFQKTLKEVFGDTMIEQARRAENGGKVTADELKAALEASDDGAEKMEALIAAVADVCSNKPTKAQIKALPFRLQQHFLGYIMGKFLSPEASTPVMTL